MNIENKKRFALLIYGPTASGKTDFALDIAKNISSEIINGDIGQLYTPLTIGTAKPDWRKELVPHHLFDVIDEPKNFTVCEYRSLVIDCVADVFSRGKLPIIVGGSGFYLKSLFFPPCDSFQKEFLYQEIDLKPDSLWDELNTVDSKRAKQIEPTDLYRVKRALAIWQNTGRKPSEFVPQYDPPIDFLIINLHRDRKELYDRINSRTGIMLKEGWIEEVERLVGTPWEQFLYKKKLIGYDFLLDYVKSEKTIDDLLVVKKKIQKATRHYAKRQQTFWRSLQRQLDDALSKDLVPDHYGKTESVDLTLLDRHLYIKQLSKRLRPFLKKV